MRLVTFRDGDRTRAGALRDDGVVALGDAADIGELLVAGRSPMDWEELAAAGSPRPLEGVELLRPVLEPGAVFCVGLNYRSHILEMGRELPEHPTLFSKLPRALTDPDAVIELPAASDKVDYEAEIALVIGSGGRNIPRERAWDAVAGLTLLNDTSMRDYQRRTIQWFAGKTWEAGTPVGPAVLTSDEVDPAAIEIVLRVNGSERQRGAMSDLVFDVADLVADLSTIVTLRPGDLIATGTPGGVGAAMEPQSFLSDGDVVEIEVPAIGILRNRFARSGGA